jgi:hypothetical protein
MDILRWLKLVRLLCRHWCKGKNNVVVLSCCRVVVLSCCRVVVLSCCRVVVLSCCCVVVLLCCCVFDLLPCCDVVLLLLFVFALLPCNTYHTDHHIVDDFDAQITSKRSVRLFVRHGARCPFFVVLFLDRCRKPFLFHRIHIACCQSCLAPVDRTRNECVL